MSINVYTVACRLVASAHPDLNREVEEWIESRSPEGAWEETTLAVRDLHVKRGFASLGSRSSTNLPIISEMIEEERWRAEVECERFLEEALTLGLWVEIGA